MENYYALIVDIVKSRGLSDEDRYDVQKKLDEATVIVNKVFDKKIVKSLSFSAGDSVQGLFDTISSAYKAYLIVKNAVFPHVIRAGIGYGNVNQIMIDKFKYEDSNKYDGKAYHLARSAIEKAKKEKVNLLIETEKRYDEMINPIIDDEKIIFMTLARKAIYSLINLLDPIIDNRHNLSFEYFSTINPLITGIVNYYRNKSRVKEHKFIMKRYASEIEKPESLNNDQVNECLEEYYNDYIKYKNKHDLTLINTPIRSLLVKLIGSKEQNINSLIKVSSMDYLRAREISKIEILSYLYGGE